MVGGGEVEVADAAVAADVRAEPAGKPRSVDLLRVVQQPPLRVGRQLAARRVEDLGAACLGLRQQPPAVLPPVDVGQLSIDGGPQPLPSPHRTTAGEQLVDDLGHLRRVGAQPQQFAGVGQRQPAGVDRGQRRLG